MMGVASQHNIKFHNVKICRIVVRYKDYVDICNKDMPTLAPHLSRHPKGIHEEERFWVEERRKSARGNGRIPVREEPQKLRGSTKSRKERVRPRAGKDRLPIITASGSTDLICEEGRRTVAVCGLPSSHSSGVEQPKSCPTDLGYARQDPRNAYHLIQIKEGDQYETELQYQLEVISRQQSNNVQRQG